jgi:MerR family transcriptional regulator, heat shock protein HspR
VSEPRRERTTRPPADGGSAGPAAKEGVVRFFLIGVAAARAGMHPQTLRVYERRGLITPRRSAGRTRLYSAEDVELLRHIQELGEEGLNLAGMKRVLDLERRTARAERRAARAERRVAELEAEVEEQRAAHARERAEGRRSASRDLVRLAPAPGAALAVRIAPIVTRRTARMRRRG